MARPVATPHVHKRQQRLLGLTVGKRPTVRNAALGSLVLVAAPLLSFFYVQGSGQVYLSEIILLCVLPIVVGRASRIARRMLFTISSLAVLWLIGVSISALIAHSGASAFIRVAANDAFTAVDTVVLVATLSILAPELRERRIRNAVAGFAIAGAMTGLLHLNPLSRIDPWKFAYGIPVALVASLVGDRLRKRGYRWLAVVPLFVPLAISLKYDFRTLAGWCAMTVVLGCRRTRSQASGRSRSHYRRVLLAGGIAVAVLAAYQRAVRAGYLGVSALYKYRSTVGQDQTLVGLLIGGRKDWVFSIEGLRHHAFLGMGSLPTLSDHEFSSALNFYAGRGNPLQAGDLLYFSNGRIPLHSFILGAWLTAGIAGLPIWVLVIRRLLWYVIKASRAVQTLPVLFLSIAGLWNVLFSPLGGEDRLLFAFGLAVVVSQYLDNGFRRQTRPPGSTRLKDSESPPRDPLVVRSQDAFRPD